MGGWRIKQSFFYNKQNKTTKYWVYETTYNSKVGVLIVIFSTLRGFWKKRSPSVKTIIIEQFKPETSLECLESNSVNIWYKKWTKRSNNIGKIAIEKEIPEKSVSCQYVQT